MPIPVYTYVQSSRVVVIFVVVAVGCVFSEKNSYEVSNLCQKNVFHKNVFHICMYIINIYVIYIIYTYMCIHRVFQGTCNSICVVYACIVPTLVFIKI